MSPIYMEPHPWYAGVPQAEATIYVRSRSGVSRLATRARDRTDLKKPPRRHAPSMRIVPIKTLRRGNLA
jgi:hypothetical protein